MTLGIGDPERLIAQRATIPAEETTILDLKENSLQTNWYRLNPAMANSLADHTITATNGTTPVTLTDMKKQTTVMKLRFQIPVIDSSESVIYDTGGHLVRPPLIES
jgi:hypothetical protein